MSSRQDALLALDKALDKVPHGVINGSWQKAVAYKAWVVQVRKTIKVDRASEAQLRVLLQNYQDF